MRSPPTSWAKAALPPLLLTIGLVLSLPGLAQAQKRVVVEPFSGPQAGGVRQALIANLQAEASIEVVDYEEMRSAMGRMGIQGSPSDTQYAQIAQSLGVAAFVDGTVRRRGRSWVLSVRVRSGADGLRLGSASWSGRTVAALRSVRRNAYARLDSFLNAAPSPAGARSWTSSGGQTGGAQTGGRTGGGQTGGGRTGGGRTGGGRTGGGRTGGGRTGGGQTGGGRTGGGQTGGGQTGGGQTGGGQTGGSGDGNVPWYARSSSGGGEGEGGWDQSGGGDEDDKGDDGEPRPRGYEALTFSLSVGSLDRSFGATAEVNACLRQVPIPDGCAAPGDSSIIPERRTVGVSGLGHAELGLEASFFPGMLLDEPVLPWVGVLFRYRNSIGLKTKGQPCEDPSRCPAEPVNLSTLEREIFMAIRGRYNYPVEGRTMRIYGDLGLGFFSFKYPIEDLALVTRANVVPPFDYSHINLGLGAIIDLVPVYLSGGVEFAFRFGLPAGAGAGVGADARSVWGTDVPKMRGWMLGFRLRSDAPYLFEGAFFGLDLDLFQFKSRFGGQPSCLAGEGQCNTPDALFEPWPTAVGPTGDVEIVGGIAGAAKDRYRRIALVLGFAWDPVGGDEGEGDGEGDDEGEPSPDEVEEDLF